MTNINTLMRRAKRVLFTDSEHFNLDVTGMTLSDIKDRVGIRGRIRKLQEYSDCCVYGFGMSGTSYNFTLKLID